MAILEDTAKHRTTPYRVSTTLLNFLHYGLLLLSRSKIANFVDSGTRTNPLNGHNPFLSKRNGNHLIHTICTKRYMNMRV